MIKLCCPKCKKEVKPKEDFYFCQPCDLKFTYKNNILDFRKDDAYWCHISKEMMNNFLDNAQKCGYDEACKLFPKNQHWLFQDVPNRSDGTLFMDVDESSIGIDIGSGWGGLLLLMAKRFSKIIGVDKTIETLALTHYKALNENRKNIELYAADAKFLPFQNSQFDFAVMNGFLEWAGEEGDWSDGNISGKQNRTSPRDLQIQTLKEAWRVLKPGGKLYLAIENRWGYTYFLGNPDPHLGKWGYNLFPKKIANIISKICLKRPYSTYIYSLGELKKILKIAGFTVKYEFTSFDDYEQPNAIMPISKESLPLLKYYFEHYHFKGMNKIKKNIWGLIIKTGLIRKIVPCFILILEKDEK
jgi:ubiquinone/menaquinone biosynthesis C-methylase UbiE